MVGDQSHFRIADLAAKTEAPNPLRDQWQALQQPPSESAVPPASKLSHLAEAGLGTMFLAGTLASIAVHRPIRDRAMVADMLRAGRQGFNEFMEEFGAAGLTTKSLSESVKPINYLGTGREATAYRIDGLARFGLLMPNSVVNRPLQGELSAVHDIWPGENVGQPVGRFGPAAIVRLVEGEPLGPPHNWNQIDKTPYFEKQAVKVAAMPQSAFDHFAQRLVDLKERNLVFEPHPANTLLDKTAQRFNVVDVKSAGQTLDPMHQTSFYSVIESLVACPPEIRAAETAKLEMYRLIAKRSMTAARRAGMDATSDSGLRRLFPEQELAQLLHSSYRYHD